MLHSVTSVSQSLSLFATSDMAEQIGLSSLQTPRGGSPPRKELVSPSALHSPFGVCRILFLAFLRLLSVTSVSQSLSLVVTAVIAE